MRWLVLGPLVCLSLFTPNRAYSEILPILPRAMATLGDSMSEGVLADYANETGIPLRELFKMARIAMGGGTSEEKVLKFRQHYAALDKSWSSGNNANDLVYSHYERIADLGEDIPVFNFAVAGSVAEDLWSQHDRLMQTQADEGIIFDYVTILIGANDLGGSTLEEITTTEDFVGTISDIASSLATAHPEIAILLSPPPEIAPIFEATADLTAYSVLGVKISCADMRKSIYGKKVLFDTTHPDFEAAEQIYFDYEDGLSMLAEDLQRKFPNAFFKSAREIVPHQNLAKAISVDCFHPSEWGQAELAEQLWNQSFWWDLF